MLTFHNNHSIIVELVKDLLQSPFVMSGYLVVALEFTLWPWQLNVAEIRVLQSMRVSFKVIIPPTQKPKKSVEEHIIHI